MRVIHTFGAQKYTNKPYSIWPRWCSSDFDLFNDWKSNCLHHFLYRIHQKHQTVTTIDTRKKYNTTDTTRQEYIKPTRMMYVVWELQSSTWHWSVCRILIWHVYITVAIRVQHMKRIDHQSAVFCGICIFQSNSWNKPSFILIIPFIYNLKTFADSSSCFNFNDSKLYDTVTYDCQINTWSAF